MGLAPEDCFRKLAVFVSILRTGRAEAAGLGYKTAAVDHPGSPHRWSSSAQQSGPNWAERAVVVLYVKTNGAIETMGRTEIPLVAAILTSL